MRHRASTWSNGAFLIPAALAITAGVYWHAALTILTLTASTLYHLHERERFAYLDLISAVALMIGNTVLLLMRFNASALVVGLFFVACAFFFYTRKEDYEFNHTMWHLCSAAITLICVIAYV